MNYNDLVSTRYIVRVKPNVNKKNKWYYNNEERSFYGQPRHTRNLIGKVIVVRDSINLNFPNTYDFNYSDSGGSLFIDKDDCELLEPIL